MAKDTTWSPRDVGPGSPWPMGATPDEDGVNFAVFSANADRIELCLFDPSGRREIARLPLPERTGDIWHGHVRGLRPGALYGLRAHGRYAPEEGHRFNANKLLQDPYARRLHGGFITHAALFGYDPASPETDLSFSTADSAPFVPKCVVTAPRTTAPASTATARLGRGWRGTFVYEAHVKGLTMTHPDVPETLRGTYEALASDAVVDHLVKLGVTTIELLPVHAFVDDGFLLDRGLRNYWGYNSIGFFALEPRYFSAAREDGFRAAVERLHAAGIEVILDVVYNHTAEGDQRGPTFSFRGLDNASYYRLMGGRPRYYINDTGTGNTLAVARPHALRMVLDSLRYWVTEYGIDGFRFDLAATLGREATGFDPRGGFLDALRQDPLLATVKLIAEPWDVGLGGYQLGRFTPEFAEWNDRYRDAVRGFWRGNQHGAQNLAARLLGSADVFDHNGRRAWSSVNFVAAHDGFTLADITSYSRKHNEANGEGNDDGHNENQTDNCGVEGPSDDAAIRARRARRRRNLLATLMLSQGTPMLLAGDEFGNSQGGNNNAYCQDNPTGWLNWDAADDDLIAFTARLAAFRREHRALDQTDFLHATTWTSDGRPDVEWLALDGGVLDWNDGALARFALTVRALKQPEGLVEDEVLIAFNASERDAKFTLPAPAGGRQWTRAIDTAAPDAAPGPCEKKQQPVAAQSVVAFAVRDRA